MTHPRTGKVCGLNFPCYDTPVSGHKVTGECVEAFNCEGKQATGLGGGMQAISQLMQLGQQIMQLFKGQEGQQSQGDGAAMSPASTIQQGCTAYYQVTAPSSDPCAYYVPPTSQSLLNSTGLGTGVSDELLKALNAGGDSALNVSDQILGVAGELPEEAAAMAEAATSTDETTAQAGAGLSGEQVALQSGTRGDIVVTDGGATIVAQARDVSANTEVAGFYGSDTFGGQPKGVIAGMCQNRPWAGSIVSFVIPPAFFDSLCAWRGYKVGTPPAAPDAARASSEKAVPAAPPAQAPAPQPSEPEVPPQVEIWAVPERVPLGTRTSIFWHTKGVESCSITSPDGSFNESTLSGGAATVPLYGPTTFTISCLTPSGAPVTDYVTVQLAI